MSNSWSLQLDCLVLQLLLVLPLLLLLVLSKWGHSYFWPETAFKKATLCIFEIIFLSSLIQRHLKKIQNKVQVPIFFSKVNLKSHAAQWLSSCWLFSQMKVCCNWLSVWSAESGYLSDADPISYGPNEYGSLQLHIQASLLSELEEDKLNFPLGLSRVSPVMKPLHLWWFSQ